MALSAAQARHTENVFHIALRQCETHLVCLSSSAESATEAFSLALHSVPRVFHLALKVAHCGRYQKLLWSLLRGSNVSS